ncbi:MAG TPA: hypothetical protein VIL35_03775 [Vicinamibacterales bacterium]
MSTVATLVDGRVGGVSTSVDKDGWPLVPPTLLTIHRTADWDEQTRQIICRVDGKRVGQLLYGETLTVEIAPGPHKLRVDNTLFWKTVEFEAEPGAHVHFTVWNRSWGGYYLMIVFIGSSPLGLGLAAGPPWELPAGGPARRGGKIDLHVRR